MQMDSRIIGRKEGHGTLERQGRISVVKLCLGKLQCN
jgi:hypothetical protein